MLIVAGAGPGNPEYLTYEVRSAIEKAETVLAFGRISESLKSIRSDIVSVKRVDEVLAEVQKSNNVLILLSGDPCFFGMVDYLKRKGVKIDKVLPGISAVQYLATRLQVPWSEAVVKSFHGRKLDVSNLSGKTCFFFTDKKNTPKAIATALVESGYKGKLYVAYNLSYPDEEIVEIRIGEELKDRKDISMVMVVLD